MGIKPPVQFGIITKYLQGRCCKTGGARLYECKTRRQDHREEGKKQHERSQDWGCFDSSDNKFVCKMKLQKCLRKLCIRIQGLPLATERHWCLQIRKIIIIIIKIYDVAMGQHSIEKKLQLISWWTSPSVPFTSSDLELQCSFHLSFSTPGGFLS